MQNRTIAETKAERKLQLQEKRSATKKQIETEKVKKAAKKPVKPKPNKKHNGSKSPNRTTRSSGARKKVEKRCIF